MQKHELLDGEYSQLQPVCSIISCLQITSLLIQPHEMAKLTKMCYQLYELSCRGVREVASLRLAAAQHNE